MLATRTKSGRRAKVEVIRWDGQLAVKKTFKLHQQRFCQCEVQALRDLAPVVDAIPPLLDSDSCSLTIPYYDDVLGYQRSSGKLLPLGIARQAVAALCSVYEAGYALVDASIDNILVDRHEGLKLIDFEFSYRYDVRPNTFAQSYDIAGCPADFSGDTPIHGPNSYDRNWRPYIGLSFESLLHDGPSRQLLKRAVYYVAHAHRFLPRLARYYFRQMVARRRRLPKPNAGLSDVNRIGSAESAVQRETVRRVA